MSLSTTMDNFRDTSWSTAVDNYGDSITGLFSFLGKLHCKPVGRAYIIQHTETKEGRQKCCRRIIYDTLFGYLIGPYSPRYDKSIQPALEMDERIGMMENIFSLRCQRRFDDANRLEELFRQLVSLQDPSCDDSDVRAVLKVLVLLAGSGQDQKLQPIGHRTVPLPIRSRTVRSDLVLPYGPQLYGDTKIIQPSHHFYMHYSSDLFSNDSTVQETTDMSKVFSLPPGESLSGAGLFSVQGYLNDSHEHNQSGSLFGGLVQGRVMSLDAKLEIPEFSDDSGIFEIRIPKRMLPHQQTSPDSTIATTTVITDTKLSSMNLSHSDSAYDTAIWEDCLRISVSKYYTWESRGSAGSFENQYMTELGPESVDQWYNMKRRQMWIMSPTSQFFFHRQITMTTLVKDLINLLIGIQSDTFILHRESGEFRIHEGTCISGITPESLSSLAEDFLQCGTNYNRLREFSMPPFIDSFYTGGLIFQAFTGAIRKVLHHITGVVLSIPHTTTVLSLRFLCHHLFHQIKFLTLLCKCDKPLTEETFEKFPKGVELLSYVYRETLESASTDNYPIMLSILQTTCGPYTLFIQEWVYHGACRDTYGEFMIEVHDDYLQFKNKNYWTHGYTLTASQTESVPLFLSQFANDIFICGKSVNLLKACHSKHFLCNIKDQDIPRISVTYSKEELGSISKQCEIYISKMQQMARQLTLSREAVEEEELQRKQQLQIRAKEVAEREIQRIQDEAIQKRQVVDEKKREQFNFLKTQMEKDLQRRADEALAAKDEDEQWIAKLTRQEEAMTKQELELEKQAKEEIIAYYQRLTEEAALREQKALWHVRRSQLMEERRKFLESDQDTWRKEMEQNPEGNRLEDLPNWARKACLRADQGPVEVSETVKVIGEEEENMAELPRWARKFLAKPSEIQEDIDSDLPKWARGRFRSEMSLLQNPDSSSSEIVSPAGKLSNPLLRRPDTPKIRTGVKLSSMHSAYAQSEETAAKPSIQMYQNLHSTQQSEESENRPHIRVSTDRNYSTESVGDTEKKLNVRMSDRMSATKQTEEIENKPHLKTIPEYHSTKESIETQELNVPKLKGRQDMHSSVESVAKEWKIKKKSLFGHVSQLSNTEFVISAPRLKRSAQIHALEPDFKDFGIRPKIRMSKQMSSSKESEEVQAKSKIKFSEKTHATKESEFVDTDEIRLEKFKQQNIFGHASDSSVERLLYSSKFRVKDVVPEGVQVEPVRFIDSPLETFRYQDVFDMFDKPPEVDILRGTVGSVYGSLGDYGISQRSDVEMCQYLPLAEVLKRSVTAPILSQVKLVNKCVLDYYFVDLSVMKHFKALRRYLFMEDGHFAQILSDILLEKFASSSKPQELLNPIFLNGALNKAIKSSVHTEDSLADNLSFSLRYQPKVLHHTAHDSLNCLELHYKVQWPLNIVITDNSISKYNQIFTLMLQLKRTVWILKDVWHRLKRDALVHKAGNSSQFRQLHLYRQEMQHFVRTMQGYIANQIIHVTWKEFNDALKKDVHNLEDLHRVHLEYLEKAVFRCLLNKKAHKVMKIIQDITAFILKFCSQLVNASWNKDPVTNVLTHSNFPNMVQSYCQFREYSGFLFKIVNKLSIGGYEPHLKELLLRLNFNDYYKA